MAVKLLRIVAPHFVAGAEWVKVGDEWECVRAAPIIAWMVGKRPAFVRDYLRRKGYVFEWITSASEADRP